MSGAGDRTLDERERRELLRVARLALVEHLSHGRRPTGAPHNEALLEARPVFVSVHLGGRLRGCMGRIETEAPLYAAVMELAVSAATSDPRFAPLTVDELPQARLEISVLSPRAPLSAPAELSLGRDGLIVSRGARRGLLLPKVAVEQGWDVERFLEETCGKAGLPSGSWREPTTTVERFTAQVFAEDA
jgi:AmmeMemoRadiSam system protein A